MQGLKVQVYHTPAPSVFTVNNYCFQPVTSETPGVYGKYTATFWAALQRNLIPCKRVW